MNVRLLSKPSKIIPILAVTALSVLSATIMKGKKTEASDASSSGQASEAIPKLSPRELEKLKWEFKPPQVLDTINDALLTEHAKNDRSLRPVV